MSSGTLVRYMLIPLAIGLAGFASIVLTGPNGDLTTSRLLIASAVLIVVPFGIDVVQAFVGRSRLAARLEREDEVHRAATVAAFEADVERITGRPFPTAEQ